MKKLAIIALSAALLLSCTAFAATSPANQTQDATTEEYLPSGTFQSEDFSITSVYIDNARETGAPPPNGHIPMGQAEDIPEDVIEEYLDPIEIKEGVYEYREADGTLAATLYTDSSKAPRAASVAATEYDIDMDVAAGSWAHGNEEIDVTTLVTIDYDIDFARQTPSYLGKYVSSANKVSWFTPASTTGFYRSINIVGSGDISVAIKNEGTQANIYTGTVSVT